MSRLSTFTCDGPACLEMAEDVEDDDDVIAEGWLVVQFQVTNDDGDVEDRAAHLHSYACLQSWAEEGATWDEHE